MELKIVAAYGLVGDHEVGEIEADVHEVLDDRDGKTDVRIFRYNELEAENIGTYLKQFR